MNKHPAETAQTLGNMYESPIGAQDKDVQKDAAKVLGRSVESEAQYNRRLEEVLVQGAFLTATNVASVKANPEFYKTIESGLDQIAADTYKDVATMKIKAGADKASEATNTAVPEAEAEAKRTAPTMNFGSRRNAG